MERAADFDSQIAARGVPITQQTPALPEPLLKSPPLDGVDPFASGGTTASSIFVESLMPDPLEIRPPASDVWEDLEGSGAAYTEEPEDEEPDEAGIW